MSAACTQARAMRGARSGRARQACAPSGEPELVSGEVLEARHDARARRDREELELDAADPADGGHVEVVQQVVRLVIEAPLADNEARADVLAALHHVDEVLLLGFLEGLVLLDRVNVDLVLGLGLRRLKGARQDRNLRAVSYTMQRVQLQRGACDPERPRKS